MRRWWLAQGVCYPAELLELDRADRQRWNRQLWAGCPDGFADPW